MGLAFLTTTRAQPCDNPVHERPSVRRNGPRILTGAVVEAEEHTVKEVANKARPIGPAAPAAGTACSWYDSEAARRRSELARDLLGRTERMMPLMSDVLASLSIFDCSRKTWPAATINSRTAPRRGDFLSPGYACRVSDCYPEVERIHAGLLGTNPLGDRHWLPAVAACRPLRTTTRSSRQLLAGSVGAGPRIDLESLNLSDVQDDEESQAASLSLDEWRYLRTPRSQLAAGGGSQRGRRGGHPRDFEFCPNGVPARSCSQSDRVVFPYRGIRHGQRRSSSTGRRRLPRSGS